jgi:hypothetical protein
MSVNDAVVLLPISDSAGVIGTSMVDFEELDGVEKE